MKSLLALFVCVGWSYMLVSQSNMEWIRMDELSNTLAQGSCSDQSSGDSKSQVLCFGLVFTPTFVDIYTGQPSAADSLVFTSYTTFFQLDCSTDNQHQIVYNQSCIMTDNSREEIMCPMIEQRFNSSGNSGSIFVKANESYLIHQVCIELDVGETVGLVIREPPQQNVQSNCSLGYLPEIVTENLDVANLFEHFSPPINSEIEMGSIYLKENCSGIVLTNELGDCFMLSIDSEGDIVSNAIACPN